MDLWVLWLIIATVLIISEMFTFSFVLVMFALGSLAAALVDVFGGNLLVQGLVFAAVSVAALAVIRPIIKQRIEPGAVAKTGVDALIGVDALVLETVNRLGGLVKINGENWSARLYDSTDNAAFTPGQFVTVHKVDGATLLVGPSGQSSVATS